MKNNEFNFTRESIKKLVPPKVGEQIYKDTEESGLILIVSNTGSKVFYCAGSWGRDEIKKKHHRIKIGNFPDLPIPEARIKVIELKAQIVKGVDPLDLKLNLTREMTFKELFDKYINDYAKHNVKRWKDDIANFNGKAYTLYDKGITTITKGEIQNIFDKLSTTGKYGANRFLDRLKSVFNKGIEWELLDKNPTNGIKKHQEEIRHRYIQEEEIDKFRQAVEAENNPIMRDFIFISLYTGARKGHVLSMRWQDINFENKTWLLPETMNSEPHCVVLVEEAIKILEERAKTAKNKWVFPSVNSASGHMEDPKKAWKRICQRSELEDLRIHDLRRTRGVWMATAGADFNTIGQALNYKDPRSATSFAKPNLNSVREYMEKADNLYNANANKDKDKV